MTRAHYPARYQDAHGSEHTTISNDGSCLRMVVRGVAWRGRDFDRFAPEAGTPDELLATFTLAGGELCQCELACEIPAVVVGPGGASTGTLTVALTLGRPSPRGGIDEVTLRIVLTWAEGRAEGTGASGWFEDELLEIQRQLPPDVYLRSCLNCQYSDYSPGGHGLFGDLLCFRNAKDAYAQVRSKETFWPVLRLAERSVQETDHCDQFARRVPGTGYRG